MENKEIKERLYSQVQMRGRLSKIDEALVSVHKSNELFKELDMSNSDMSEIESKLNELKKQALGVIDDLNKEIDKIREECAHDFVNVGHDSHKDLWVCSKCGKEEWV